MVPDLLDLGRLESQLLGSGARGVPSQRRVGDRPAPGVGGPAALRKG